MKMFRKDEGFTLVELMVVVLIIGILVAIAIPVFNAAKARAEERQCFANERTVEGAAQQWLADQEGAAVMPADADTLKAALVPNFVKEWPTCKSGGVYAWDGSDTLTCGAGATFAGHGHY